MDRFFSFLIKHRIFIITLFVLLCVPAVLGMDRSKTSFDISTFLPKDSNSIEGAKLEEAGFSSGASTYILLENKENWRILELKKAVEAVEGVKKAEWLGDVLDIYKPEEFIPKQALEQYKKGSSEIMIITFSEQMGNQTVDGAVEQIDKLVQQGEYFGGSPVIINELKRMLKSEQPAYLAIAGGILILILMFSLSSFIAPFLCLLNIGVAIVLNYGTNFLVKSQISFLTVAIASILQLAISMDFSIFLIHRFEEDLEKTAGTNKAMVSALRATLTAISSSALTDCAGFIALMFMQNQIGADLGVVLCKGVVFSLITSLTLLPCLILATYGLGKRKHRVLLPEFKKLSGPLVKYRYALLAVVVAAFIPAFLGGQNQEYYYTSDNFMPGSSAPIIATNKISDTFGTTDTINVLYSIDMAELEREAIEAVESLPNVRSAGGLSGAVDLGFPESFLPDKIKDAFIGGDYRRFSVTLQSSLTNGELFLTIDSIRSACSQYLGQVYLTGSDAAAADMASTAKTDNLTVDLVSIALIFLIVMIAFRSLLVPVFLVLVIKGAIYINVGLNYFTGEQMIFLTPVFVGAIQLGATVDYAILFTSRYFEFRHKAIEPRQAVRETIMAVTRPLLTSMLTFFFATLSITMISSIKATREIATVVGRGALISYTVIMFALPALYVLFDRPLLATTWEFRKRKNKEIADNEGMMVS